MRPDGGAAQLGWVVHCGGEPIPPCTGVVACRTFVRENEIARTLLWVWNRARERGRDARHRVLAWTVATELWRRHPHPDVLDRAAVAAERRLEALFQRIEKRKSMRVAGRVDHDLVWAAFRRESGGATRVRQWVWPPRGAKGMVAGLTDEQVQRIDGALDGAFECYGCEMSTDDAWFLFQAAEQRIEATRVHLEEDTSGGSLGWFRLAPLALELVRAAAWYWIEVERGHAPRCWYCPGCQDWHVQAKGRPPRHHAALMDLVREAERRGGVARGDAKEVLRKVGERRNGAMPTLRYWQKFIVRHNLGPRRRARGIRRRRGRYEFFALLRRRVAS